MNIAKKKYGTFFSQIAFAVENGEEKNIENALEKLINNGLSSTDIDSCSAREYGAENLRKLHSDFGISISSMFHLLDFDYHLSDYQTIIKDDIKTQLEVCLEAGAPIIMPVPVIKSNHKDETERLDALKYTTDYISSFVDEASKYNIKVAVENFSSTKTTLAYISDIEYILNNVPDAGYVLDCGNFWFSGADVMEACRRFSSRTVHVHLKDIDDRLDGICVNGKTARSVAIGEGILPLYDVIDLLTNKGYDSFYTIEINHNEEMLSSILRSLNNLNIEFEG